jgi:hypothetical protein
MHSLKDIQLKCNKQFIVNFDGGELSSDGGLLMIKEFLHVLGLEKLLKNNFKTNDPASFRIHKDDENLLQMIYQIFGTYYEDNCADELRNDPILSAVLGKEALASQPTLSRFFNRMDDDTLRQFDGIMLKLRKKVYSVRMPEFVLFDIDTTLLPTYGHQEGEGFNFHYQAHGYHPLLCYDGLTGDLLRAQLRDGTDYCSKNSAGFMEPLIAEYRENYPDIRLYARGDSGFATPELYDLFEDNGVKYAIRLKINQTLLNLAQDKEEDLMKVTRTNMVDYALTYGEFYYQASSWREPRRVVFKIEKPYNQMTYMYTFIVTNMEELEHWQVIDYYCNRGRMENFIGEGKQGFGFASVSSKSRTVNANRLQLHALVYNIFNWFRRLVLPKQMNKNLIDTVRLKLLKIAARVVHTGRYVKFKLCSSCPYKEEVYATFNNIWALAVQLR